jgi:hypothetical protein
VRYFRWYKKLPTHSTQQLLIRIPMNKLQTRKVYELRQRLRMRGLRCNIVYTHAASRLNVTPIFASRTQALRLDPWFYKIVYKWKKSW